MTETPDSPFRILPRVGPENEHFWKGGAEGELRFLRCGPCGLGLMGRGAGLAFLITQ